MLQICRAGVGQQAELKVRQGSDGLTPLRSHTGCSGSEPGRALALWKYRPSRNINSRCRPGGYKAIA